MRYHALACDYDGTLASHGQVDERTLAALERLRNAGRRLILVTGRQLGDLLEVFPQAGIFDRIVAENGALLYHPGEKEERLLAEAAPAELAGALRARGVEPVSVGRSIIATWEPHQAAAVQAIHDLGLEYHVIFNKGAVMLLPSGVNKATGLKAALEDLGLSPHNTAGVGDAENDHAFLTLCECSAAVSNALPMIKKRVDLVTRESHGAGVVELIDAMIAGDLKELEPRLERHHLPLGTREDGGEVRLPPHGWNVLLAGDSGSGKSTFAKAFLEQLAGAGRQFCVIDPEGDYDELPGAVTLGDDRTPPSVEGAVKPLEKPAGLATVNLLGIPVKDRPRFFETLFPRLQDLRLASGRPHWILIDEAHHLLPPSWNSRAAAAPEALQGVFLVTVHPDQVSPGVLKEVDAIFAIGPSAAEALAAFCRALGEPGPPDPGKAPRPGEALAWMRRDGGSPFLFRTASPRGEHRRHVRKYSAGLLSPDKSFYFRGPEGKLNLRAQNLMIFLQLAEGVDEETWLYHLRRGDYSRWFRECISDGELADEAARAESGHADDPGLSREALRTAIQKRYTAPAESA